MDMTLARYITAMLACFAVVSCHYKVKSGINVSVCCVCLGNRTHNTDHARHFITLTTFYLLRSHELELL